MKKIWNYNKCPSPFIIMAALSIIVGPFCFINVHATPPLSPPVGHITCSATSNTTGNVTFDIYPHYPNRDEIIIIVYVNGTANGYLSFPDRNATMEWTGISGNITASFFDHNPTGKIDSGDYINFTGLFPNTDYAFSLYHIPSQSVIMLVGGTDFGTPPNPPLSETRTYSTDFPDLPTITSNPDEAPSYMILLISIILCFVGLISLAIYIRMT
jgi:hypothetical protein